MRLFIFVISIIYNIKSIINDLKKKSKHTY